MEPLLSQLAPARLLIRSLNLLDYPTEVIIRPFGLKSIGNFGIVGSITQPPPDLSRKAPVKPMSPEKNQGATHLPPAPTDKIDAILNLLDIHYPDSHCTLNFETPFQLLVATILSAQCTDQRVNQVTSRLFSRCPDPASLYRLSREELEELIRPAGLYRSKAKSLKGCCEMLLNEYHGQVPRSLPTLIKLPGVGRKTANVILGNAFGIPGITVDTHVRRVAGRLGLSGEQNPDKIERDLMAIIPKDRWTMFCHRIIEHGRTLCQARNPDCTACPLRPLCPHGSGLTS